MYLTDPPNVSAFMGQMSPDAMARLFNVFGLHFDKNESGQDSVGVLVVPLVVQRLEVSISLSEGYNPMESMAVSLRYQDANGVSSEIIAGELNNENTPEQGTYLFSRAIPDVPRGAVIEAIRDYTPGPGPKGTSISVAFVMH